MKGKWPFFFLGGGNLAEEPLLYSDPLSIIIDVVECVKIFRGMSKTKKQLYVAALRIKKNGQKKKCSRIVFLPHSEISDGMISY